MTHCGGDQKGWRLRGVQRLTGQKAVKLDQELQVGIVALGGLAVGAAHVVAVEIDTYKQTRVSSSAFGSGMLRRDWQHSRNSGRDVFRQDSIPRFSLSS